jgi:twinkle protein
MSADIDRLVQDAIDAGVPLDERGMPLDNPEPRKDWSDVVVGLNHLHDLHKRFFRKRPDGLRLPWEKTRDLVQFAHGRWTIWSGPTFSGKTHVLRQLALHSARSGQKVFFASLEEEPDEIRDLFVMMAAQARKPSPHFVQTFGEWANPRIMLAETIEMLSVSDLMDMLKHAAYVEGCKQLFVDSLMRLRIPTDDYEGQRKLGNTLSKFVKQYRVHVHLVCHPRKTTNSRAAVDLYDIRGAADLVAQADNVVVVGRNYEAELPDPSNTLEVFKQRGMKPWVGKIGLHYHESSKQFLGEMDDEPMQFMDWEQYPAVSRGPLVEVR